MFDVTRARRGLAIENKRRGEATPKLDPFDSSLLPAHQQAFDDLYKYNTTHSIVFFVLIIDGMVMI